MDSYISCSARLHRHLSKEERIRRLRFHFFLGRERFIVGRGALREILGSYLNTTAGCLRFSEGSNRKPCLADDHDIRFNVSRSAGSMVVAVTREREVGADIERLGAHVSGELAESVLSPPERDALGGLEGEAKERAFLTLWTRKEAFVKADGRGMSLTLTDVDVSLPDGGVAVKDPATDAWSLCTRWRLRTPDFGPDHVAALAAEGDDWDIAWRQWPDDLAESPHPQRSAACDRCPRP